MGNLIHNTSRRRKGRDRKLHVQAERTGFVQPKEKYQGKAGSGSN